MIIFLFDILFNIVDLMLTKDQAQVFACFIFKNDLCIRWWASTSNLNFSFFFRAKIIEAIWRCSWIWWTINVCINWNDEYGITSMPYLLAVSIYIWWFDKAGQPNIPFNPWIPWDICEKKTRLKMPWRSLELWSSTWRISYISSWYSWWNIWSLFDHYFSENWIKNWRNSPNGC